MNTNDQTPTGYSDPLQSPAEPVQNKGSQRNIYIITAGVVITLAIIAFFIYSEAPQKIPINLNDPFASLPADTSSVIYINGRDTWGAFLEKAKEVTEVMETETADDVTAPENANVEDDAFDEYFESAEGETFQPIGLMDQMKSLRNVEKAIIAFPRTGMMPTMILSPFNEPELLLDNIQGIPGFTSSKIIEPEGSRFKVMQVKFTWMKLLYLSAAEQRHLFVGDGSYYLKTIKGFERPADAVSMNKGPIAPLLDPYEAGTLVSIVKVISYPEDIEARIAALEQNEDDESIALLAALKDLGAALRNLNAIRIDIVRNVAGGPLAAEISLLFSSPEHGRVFQAQVDKTRALMSLVVGALVPRDVGRNFDELIASVANAHAQERVVTMTIQDAPAKLDAFMSSLGLWLGDQIDIRKRLKPAA